MAFNTGRKKSLDTSALATLMMLKNAKAGKTKKKEKKNHKILSTHEVLYPASNLEI